MPSPESSCETFETPTALNKFIFLLTLHLRMVTIMRLSTIMRMAVDWTMALEIE